VSVSGHTATLSAASQVAFTGTAMAVYGTDDTAKIQAAFDDIATDGGGQIYIPAWSMVNGALLEPTSTGANCQIKIPPLYQPEEPVSFTLCGPRFPGMGLWGNNQHQSFKGAGIYSPLWAKDAAAAHPAIIGSVTWDGDVGRPIRFSTAQLIVRNLGFKGTNGSSLSRVQYRYGGNMIFRNVAADYDVAPDQLASPVDANPLFAWPTISNNSICECHNLYTVGGHTALQIGEHFHATGACALNVAVVGVKLEGNGWPLSHAHGQHFDRLLCQAVAKHLTAIDGVAVVTIDRLEAENLNVDSTLWPWASFQGNLQESANGALGHVKYSQFMQSGADGHAWQMTADSTSDGQGLSTLNMAQRAYQEGIARAVNTSISSDNTWVDIITQDLPAGKYWLDAGIRITFDVTPSGGYGAMQARIYDETGAVEIPGSMTLLHTTTDASPARVSFQSTFPLGSVLLDCPLLVGAVNQRRVKLQARRLSFAGSPVFNATAVVSDTNGYTWLRWRPYTASH
jgi:hypothetical protein